MNLRGKVKKELLKNKKLITEIIFACIILSFCEVFFFRNVLGTNRAALIADRADGRLTTLLTEHWWRVLLGLERFSELSMFYPAPNVLGYTDLFMGYGILYCAFRFLGINMFVAYKWTLICTHLFGTVTMYYLLRKKIRVQTVWALFGTVAFSFSDTYARHMMHTQLVAISYLPLLLIFLYGFLESFECRKRRNIYAYLLISWFALIAYNSWYVACFTGFFVLVFSFVFAIVLLKKKNFFLSKYMETLSAIWKDALCYVLYLVLIFVPFMKVYFPVLKSSSGYSYSTCIGYLPEFADIINLSEGNWMIGWLVRLLKLSERGYSYEVTQGFSIILLCSFAFFSYSYLQSGNEEESEKGKLFYLTNIAIIITIIVCIFSIVRLSANGVSMWFLFYTVIPVVRSMRAIARFWLWLSFPISVVSAYLGNKYFENSNKKYIAVVFLLLLFVSNINTVGVFSIWDENTEIAKIEEIEPPPEEVEYFFIYDSSHSGEPAYMYQLDAFEIATIYSIKTINGYSGQMPEEWDGMWDVEAPVYLNGVKRWADKHGLNNLYMYDKGTNSWVKYTDEMILIDSQFNPSENRFSLCNGNEDNEQGDFAWIGKHFSCTIDNPRIFEDGLKIKYISHLERYLAQDPDVSPKMQLWIDGEYVQDLPISNGDTEVVVSMSNHVGSKYNIEIISNFYFVPKDIGINGDTRELSVAIKYIGN